MHSTPVMGGINYLLYDKLSGAYLVGLLDILDVSICSALSPGALEAMFLSIFSLSAANPEMASIPRVMTKHLIT